MMNKSKTLEQAHLAAQKFLKQGYLLMTDQSLQARLQEKKPFIDIKECPRQRSTHG
jgi:hypothetical protein